MFDEGWEAADDPDAALTERIAAVTGTDDDELLTRTIEIERERNRLDAEQAAVLAELEARGTCDRDLGLGTAAWLARDAALPSDVARRRVKVATKLHRHLPDVADALTDGTIGWEHARVLAELANPRILDDVADNQTMLIGLADRCRFDQWRSEVRGLANLWDQDGGYNPNEDPNAAKLSFGRSLDGLVSLAATLTGDDAEVVIQAIEAEADHQYKQAVADHKICGDLEIPSRSTLRARALTALIRRALGIDIDTSKGPKVEATIVINADDPTHASDPDGVPLADGTTRVLACDAELHALVVDRLGVPLDLARHVRWATEGQRRGARARDGGCTFPGCDARVMWCDIHHCVHDEHGGVTDLCNLVCLCRHHHGVTHRTGWSVRLDEDGWAIFQSPSGHTFWGQRHGRQREGPPPDPLYDPTDPHAERHHQHPPDGSHVVPGRDRASTRELRAAILRRLADDRPPHAA